MGKADPFKDRPKLPSREQIVADLNLAENDDVAFSEIKDSSAHLHKTSSTREHSELNGATPLDTETLNKNYQHVTRLIELETRLKKESEELQEKYEQLERLGRDVSTSITELKSAAELMIKKS